MRSYTTLNFPFDNGGETLLTGIRECKGKYLISGFYNFSNGDVTSFLCEKEKEGKEGKGEKREEKWNLLNFPNYPTNIYGPDYNKRGNRAVGNYFKNDSSFGCLYDGKEWKTLIPSSRAINTIAHSIMGNLIVGNYEKEYQKSSRGFIYDIKEDKYYKILRYLKNPDSVKSISIYGIWKNDKYNYTIAGGYIEKRGYAFIADWDNKNKLLFNFTKYEMNNSKNLDTHFNGISKYGENSYSLVGDYVKDIKPKGFMAIIKRKEKGFSKKGKWFTISYPESELTSSNSISKSTIIGVYVPPETNGYISDIIF